jgi:hypothetical protein
MVSLLTRRILFVLLPLAAATAVARADEPGTRPQPLAIVVARSSGLRNISATELEKIFRGERPRDPDGNRYVVLMREPGCAERVAALAAIYRMTEAEYKKYFLQATFTGALQSAPKQVRGAAALRQVIAETPGAIGYLKVADVDDTVRVLAIDGKLPDDADYALRPK